MTIRNIPGESGVTHTICESDGKMCELGMLAASLAEGTNQSRIQAQNQLAALAGETIVAIRQRHEAAAAQRPGIEKYLEELTSASSTEIQSQVPKLSLCRAVCEGRRKILGCNVKTI